VAIGVVVFVAVASVAVLVSVRVGRDLARRQPLAGGEAMASEIVAPLVTQGVYDGDTRALVALDERVMVRKAGSTIARIKVWSQDGVIVYCDDPRQISLRFPLGPDRVRAMADQRVESTVADLSAADAVLDRGFGQAVEVDAGVRDTSGRPILVQTYFTVDRLDADEATVIHRVVAIVVVSLLVLTLLLVTVAYMLGRRVSRASGPVDPR
jgi:hypothetical protein